MLDEISEVAATGDIAVIYSEIRDCLGVPMVNAIYRHIATMPNALRWSWGILKPYYADGTFALIAKRLTFEAGSVTWPVSSKLIFNDPQERRDVRRIFKDFNHSNSLNLAAFTWLRQTLIATSGATAPVLTRFKFESADPPSLTLPSLSRDQSEQLSRVLRLQGVDRFGLIPTIYQNLACWPHILRQVLVFTQSAITLGVLQASVTRLIAAAEKLSQDVLPPLQRGRLEPSGEAKEQLRLGMDDFTRLAIPQMLTIGVRLYHKA